MPVPPGAERVIYKMTQYDPSVIEINLVVDIEIANAPDILDAAAQAGMEALAASLQAANPQAPVRCSRSYATRQTDGTWPAPTSA